MLGIQILNGFDLGVVYHGGIVHVGVAKGSIGFTGGFLEAFGDYLGLGDLPNEYRGEQACRDGESHGEFDDWEESAKEAGNLDSQILLPQLPDEDDDGEGGGAEPTLLL